MKIKSLSLALTLAILFLTENGLEVFGQQSQRSSSGGTTGGTTGGASTGGASTRSFGGTTSSMGGMSSGYEYQA